MYCQIASMFNNLQCSVSSSAVTLFEWLLYWILTTQILRYYSKHTFDRLYADVGGRPYSTPCSYLVVVALCNESVNDGRLGEAVDGSYFDHLVSRTFNRRVVYITSSCCRCSSCFVVVFVVVVIIIAGALVRHRHRYFIVVVALLLI